MPAAAEETGPLARRPQDWTPAEILDAVMESSRLSGAELGAFLRRKGIHEAHLDDWRARILAGLAQRPVSANASAESRRVKDLERELLRKDRALAEAAALLVLEKKVRALWGDGADSTTRGNDA